MHLYTPQRYGTGAVSATDGSHIVVVGGYGDSGR
jgi:hypothetical protein